MSDGGEEQDDHGTNFSGMHVFRVGNRVSVFLDAATPIHSLLFNE
jgi:hypothetical protein